MFSTLSLLVLNGLLRTSIPTTRDFISANVPKSIHWLAFWQNTKILTINYILIEMIIRLAALRYSFTSIGAEDHFIIQIANNLVPLKITFGANHSANT